MPLAIEKKSMPADALRVGLPGEEQAATGAPERFGGGA